MPIKANAPDAKLDAFLDDGILQLRRSRITKVLADHLAWLESEGKVGARADLCGANLVGLDLSGANLRCADLSGANLAYSSLADADLGASDLTGANLQDADLRGADLRRAYLDGADLRRADLRGTRVFRFSLDAAYLEDALLDELLDDPVPAIALRFA